jgi:hypothetical protein
MKGRILFGLAKSKVCSGRELYSVGLAFSPEGGLVDAQDIRGFPKRRELGQDPPDVQLFNRGEGDVVSRPGCPDQRHDRFQAVGPAQSEIQKDEVKGLPVNLGHRVGRVAYSDHPVAFFLQAVDQGLADIVLVFHYEGLEGIGEAIRVMEIVIQR